MEYTKVRDGDIIVGKPIERNAYDKDGILLLRKGQVIESEKQVVTLIQRGLFYLEGQTQNEPPPEIPPEKQTAFDILDAVQSGLDHMFYEVATGISKGFAGYLMNICKMIMDACDQDEDASIGYIFLGTKIRYTVKHPLDIAVMAEVISREMKWHPDERLLLMAAALTSNIGMLQLQDKLFTQKEPLTDEQKKAIREHPEHGVELLSEAGVADRVWLDGVLHHHEAIDGNGYPSGLKGSDIPLSARIVAVGDRYCAAVSNRKYRKSLMPHEAMREIFLTAGKEIDTELVKLCVKLTGIYPPGVFVRLMNGEIAVVTNRGVKAHLPIVRSIVRVNGNMFLNPVRRDCSKEEYSIKEIIVSEENRIRVNPRQLWGQVDIFEQRTAG